MAHDISDETAKPRALHAGQQETKTFQIDISASTTLSNVCWIRPGVKSAMVRCGGSSNAVTGSFSICNTYDGTFIPLTSRYPTGDAATVTVQNPVIVSVATAATAMNVTDLFQGGGFFAKVVMSGAEGTTDLFFYLDLTF